MSLKSKLRGIYLKLYFYFNNKILFKDRYGLTYYLYKNTRPNNTFNLGVRSDDTTVLYTIDKILSTSTLMNNSLIHCIDVGGYIGVVTLRMSKSLQNVKKKWKIHTFEPFEESFSRLQENINLDPFKSNIVLNNVAVSNTAGMSALKIYKNAPGENHLDSNILQNNENDISNNSVKVITLKDYIYENNIKHISICKIDAEGSDYFVIKGLHKYLEEKIVDYFIFEYQLETYEKIKNILSANGYIFYYMVRNKNILVNSLENYPKNCKSLLNLIAVSPDKKNDFTKKFKTK